MGIRCICLSKSKVEEEAIEVWDTIATIYDRDATVRMCDLTVFSLLSIPTPPKILP